MTPDEEDLLDHVFDYLCEEQPETVADIADDEIRRRAALGIRRAQGHGIEQPEAITAYVSLMFLVAPDFDVHPKIGKVLADTSVPAALRMKQIFSRTSEADWEEAAEKSAGWDALA
ncbi:MAG: hypothetical protein J0H49_36795 [Acidobacteria bacterium]|nr:hypothetical protein [Acidobacteriota bacterium]